MGWTEPTSFRYGSGHLRYWELWRRQTFSDRFETVRRGIPQALPLSHLFLLPTPAAALSARDEAAYFPGDTCPSASSASPTMLFASVTRNL